MPKTHRCKAVCFYQSVCADCVHTSEKWRETEAKYGSNVPVDRTVQDVVLETPDCLVDKPRH